MNEQNINLFNNNSLNNNDYLCFISNDNNGEISLNKSNLSINTNIEFSKDKLNWKKYEWANLNGNAIKLNKFEKVWFRSILNENSFSKNLDSYFYFKIVGNMSCSGNIMSLIDNKCSSLSIKDDFCFTNLFKDCKTLITGPCLPALILSKSCYEGLFYNCTSLIVTPKLPAVCLMDRCYTNMFYNCKSLVSCSELPASEMKIGCYSGMFSNCSSLLYPPVLLSKNLNIACYDHMFYGCSSLINTPDLLADTLYERCYQYMFYGCSSIQHAMKLNSQCIKDLCYFNMFNGCSSLKYFSDLPSTKLAKGCYKGMFENCSSLLKTPELPATKLSDSCYKNMFSGCVSLTSGPYLIAKESENLCYENMFSNCINLKYLKSNINYIKNIKDINNWLYNVNEDGIFDGNYEIIHNIPNKWKKIKNNYYIKNDNKNVIKINEDSSEQILFNNFEFYHIPIKNSIYTLINYDEDDNCKIIIDINYKNGIKCKFKDINDNEIIPKNIPKINMNDTIKYICRYSYASKKWIITSFISNSYNGNIDEPDETIGVSKEYVDEKNNLLLTKLENHIKNYNLEKHVTDEEKKLWNNSVFNNKISYIQLVKPKNGIHLIIKEIDKNVSFNNAKIIIDTKNNKTDRSNVQIFLINSNSGNWINCPEYGFESFLDGNIIKVDISSKIKKYPTTLCYAWYDEYNELSDWHSIFISNDTVYSNDQILLNILDESEFLMESSVLINHNDYLTFTAIEKNSSIRLNKINNPYTISLQYTLDNKNWKTYKWNKNIGQKITLNNVNDFIKFKAINNNNLSKDCNNYYQFVMSGRISASGSIDYLLNENNLNNLSEKHWCYFKLFSNCSSLISAPILPATILSDGCYKYMFENCKNLCNAPDLPANELTNECYSYMFSGCNKLNNINVSFMDWNISKNSTYKWLNKVSLNGNFICQFNLNIEFMDDSHVPLKWNINKF